MKKRKITASLAPMAGYTDAPFRRICSKMGAAYTTSEMISSVAMVNNDRKTAALARIEDGEAPCVLQIFGHDPHIMAKAADILLSGSFSERYYAAPPAGIDINMGCPVKKIFSSGDGSAMMKNPELAADVVCSVAEVCEKYRVPLSVKMRLGVDAEHINAPELAERVIRAGAKKITLHTRTREQMYAPSASPSSCMKVKNAIDKIYCGANCTADCKAVLVGNGDIETPDDAEKYLSFGCDEVAVGRGALGFPWIFKALSDPENFTPPSTEEIIALAVEFVEDVVHLKGEDVGIKESRGRAAHFIKGMRGSARVRDSLNHAVTLSEFTRILRTIENSPADE